LVSQAVGDVLGMRARGEGSWEQTLVAALRTRRLVLLMDGCEHLLAACARLVELVLRTCPGVHVLATSREPLGVEGEVVWRGAPVSLPAGGGSGGPPRGRGGGGGGGVVGGGGGGGAARSAGAGPTGTAGGGAPPRR